MTDFPGRVEYKYGGSKAGLWAGFRVKKTGGP